MRIAPLLCLLFLTAGCDPRAADAPDAHTIDGSIAPDRALQPEPAEPEPVEPEPVEPEPAEPEASEPEPTEPEPTEPEPTEPEPTEPEPTEPEPVEPEPVEPEPVEPEPVEPEPVEPEPAEPEPAEPEPAEPEPAEPEPAPPVVCHPSVIGPDDVVDDWYYAASIEPNGGPLADMCPVIDQSIRRGADALFAFTAQHGGEHVFRTTGRVTMASVHQACDRNVEPMWCTPSPHHHDPGLGRRPYQFTRTLAPGEMVFIQLDGFHPEQIGLRVFPPRVPGESCGQSVCDREQRCASARCVAPAICADAICQIDPPPAAEGMDCNHLRPCADGLYCQDGQCAIAPAPVFESAWANWHAGTLHLEIVLDDPARTIEGRRLMIGERTIAANRNWDFRSTITVSHAFDPMPAEVALVDGAGETWLRIPVVPQPERAIGEACALRRRSDRCALGSICAGPVDDARCVATEVHAWVDREDPDHAILDLRGPTLTERHVLRADSTFQAMSIDDARWIGRSFGPAAGPLAITCDDDLLVADLPVRQPPRRGIGEVCDPGRVADWCPVDTACITGLCETPRPPVLEAGEAFWDARRGRFGMWLRGRDVNRDLAGWILGRRDGLFEPAGRSPWYSAAVTVDGDRFEAWVSFEERNLPVFDEMGVSVFDGEGLVSERLQIPVNRAPDRPVMAAGARCDRASVLYPCADPLSCDVADGSGDPLRCVAPAPRCPAGLAIPLDLEVPVAVADLVVNHTHTTCPHRDGPDQYFEFVAPAAGRYQFDVTSNNGAAVAIRRDCLYPLSEITCGSETRRIGVQGGIGTAVLVELEADERVTVVVDGLPDFEITATRR